MEQNNTKTAVQEDVGIDLHLITNTALDTLDARSKDIIVRRFGLGNTPPETLESIGKEYGITRERVRQIETNAKKALAQLEDAFKPIYDMLSDVFEKHGGALAEEHVIELTRERLNPGTSQEAVHFHLHILPDFEHIASHTMFDPHWRHSPVLHENIDLIIAKATEILKEKRHPMKMEDITNRVKSTLKEQGIDIQNEYIDAALRASKHIRRSAFNEWGLAGWAETSPRGVGDKAYVVLRRHGKPAHFREITQLINDTKFDHKKANAQTVHNELIKDKRFVLVGRGLYALKEWGYTPGTVANVLEAILRKEGKPMSREDLIDAVLKQRLVKKNTILLSLQNNNRFKKTNDNLYTVQ